MKNNSIIKQLRNIDKRTFTALNTVFGFDFEKPFTTAKIKGAFTINKIWKELNEKHNCNDSVVVVLMVQDDNICTWKKHTITKLEGANNINIDFRLHSTDCKAWDTLYSKGDFHELRKIAKCCYIIAQKKEHMYCRKRNCYGYATTESNHDLSQRFVVSNEPCAVTRWVKHAGDSQSYISRVYLIDPSQNKRARRFEYSPAYSIKNPFAEVSEIIDKSGYLIHIKRAELATKAQKLREQRAVEGFKATNNTAIITAAHERVKALQDALVKALQNATTSGQINNIERALSSWSGLGGVFSSFERLSKGEREKTFASIADFNKALLSLNEKIDELYHALIEKGVIA